MSDDQRPVYTWEWTVFHKRLYVAHFFEQDEPSYVNTTKKRLAAIQQAFGRSRGDVMHEVLQAGIGTLEDEIKEGKREGVKVPERGDPGYEDWAIAQEYRLIWEERQRIADLQPIYNRLGLEGFVAWCDENGVKYKDFLNHFTWRSEHLTRSERAANWLQEYLRAREDGAPRQEVFEAAQRIGITDSEYSEDSLRKLGERLGLHKNDPRHGQWKWG